MEEAHVAELESVANFLRGMSLDPNLPKEFKTHVLNQAMRIDAITNIYEE